MKGVKCLACQWEDGGFGVIPCRENEGMDFDMQYAEKEIEETESLWEGGVVCVVQGEIL